MHPTGIGDGVLIKPRRMRSKIQSFTSKKVSSCGKMINNIKLKFPRIASVLISLNGLMKVVFYWLDVISDFILALNLRRNSDLIVSGSNN